jgi:hypothetical protein
MMDYWQGHCAYCGEVIVDLEGDHFIPVASADCPGTTLTNMVPACRSCNASKNDSEPTSWIGRSFGTTSAMEIIQKITTYFKWVEHSS